MDLVGPLQGDPNHSHLLTVIDRWTNWPEAIPLSDTKTSTIVTALIRHWIAIFGVPDRITSDRGSQFTSTVWKQLCSELGMKPQRTTSFHPAANGKVERFNRTLKDSLRSRLENNSNWIHELPWALIGIRNSPNDDTKLSPADITLGHKLSLPGHLVEDSKWTEPISIATENLRNYIKNQRFIAQPLHNNQRSFVRKDLDKSEYVFVKNDVIHPTSKPKFVGPFRVLNRSAKYYTLDMNGNSDTVSIDRLKPYICH